MASYGHKLQKRYRHEKAKFILLLQMYMLCFNRTEQKECHLAAACWKVHHKITDGVNFMILFHSSQREMRALLSWSQAKQQFHSEKVSEFFCTDYFRNICPPLTFVGELLSAEFQLHGI